MPAGESVTVIIRAQVDPGTEAGEEAISNTATVSTTTTDPNDENDSATETTDVIRRFDLAVTKGDIMAILAGDALIYTITVTNNGPSSSDAVTLTHVLPGAPDRCQLLHPHASS